MATATRQTRKCEECGTPIKGRSDKRFCSDACRVAFHNRLNSDETNYMRNVNNALRRNRRILAGLNPNGKTKVPGTRLTEQGFDFRYHTHLYKTKDGAVYYYCYEQGYLPIDNGYYLLVVKPDFANR